MSAPDICAIVLCAGMAEFLASMGISLAIQTWRDR